MDSRRIQLWGKAAILVAAVLIVYAPSYRADFIWDDNYLVWDNPLNHGWAGLKSYWFSAQTAWPLSATLIWLDWQCWGNQPLGYHVQTIVFHAANAVWLWFLLRNLRVKGAWLAALLWAVHPVNVATVGWISELKNTFSTLLALPGMWAYLKFDESGRWRFYGIALGLFVLAMLAKSAVIGLPFVLLLCVWWKRGGLRRDDWLRMVPWMAVATVLGGITIWSQIFNPTLDHSSLATVGNWAARLAAAGRAVWFYIGKTLLPLNLMMVYPRWQISPSNPLAYVPVLAVIGVVGIGWRYRQGWGRHALLAVGSFLLLIFPVLGFVNMTYMMHTLVADHFQYLPMAATIAGVAAGVSIFENRHRQTMRIAAGIVAVGLAVATAQRAWILRGHEPLWRDTIARNPSAWVAYYHLGTELGMKGERLFNDGQHPAARAAYLEAEYWLRLGAQQNPRYKSTFHNWGTVLLRLGHPDDGIAVFRQALVLDGNDAIAHHGLGVAWRDKGDLVQARQHLTRAAGLNQEGYLPSVQCLYEIALAQGRTNDAVRLYRTIARRTPGDPIVQANLGYLLGVNGDTQEAIASLRNARRVYPRCANIHNNLGIALENTGSLSEALACYRDALALEPASALFSNNLARARGKLAGGG